MRKISGGIRSWNTTPTSLTASLRAPTIGSAAITGLAPVRRLAALRGVDVGALAISSAAPSVSVESGEVEDTAPVPLVGDLLWTGLVAARLHNHIRTIRIRGG